MGTLPRAQQTGLSERRVRLAVAGAGLIGQRHAALIDASPSAELAGIADPAPHRVAVAHSLGTSAYETLEALLVAERPDGVVLATPNAMHREGVLTCLGAGVAVLVEKPIATSVADGLSLAHAAERARVPLLVGHHRRYSPLIVAALDHIASGEMGQVVAVMGAALFYKPDEYFDAAPWRALPGGGPILINLIHEIDSLRLLVGEIMAVQAMASNEIRGSEVEDTVAVAMSFAGGALGTFLLSDTAASVHSWEQTSGEDPAFSHDPTADCYLIAGTRGTLAVPTMRVSTATSGPSWTEPMQWRQLAVDHADPLARQLEHFSSVVRGEVEPLVTARDAVQTLRVTQAVSAAVRSEALVACGPEDELPDAS